MARIILVTGGARSGKSEFAIRLAERLPGPRAFVATCPTVDDETAARIARHKVRRSRGEWRTCEETLDIARVIGSLVKYRVILVECLTLWVNNLIFHESEREPPWNEDRMRSHASELLGVCRPIPATVIFVTNEVGMGIVPDNALTRRWRDLVGTCNQSVAEGADEVFLVSCGLPLRLKGPAGNPETRLDAPHAVPPR